MPHNRLTYELYIDEGSDEPRFEPLICSDHQEAISAVRQIIEDRGLRAVEVRLMGEVLFTLRG